MRQQLMRATTSHVQLMQFVAGVTGESARRHVEGAVASGSESRCSLLFSVAKAASCLRTMCVQSWVCTVVVRLVVRTRVCACSLRVTGHQDGISRDEYRKQRNAALIHAQWIATVSGVSQATAPMLAVEAT